MPLPTTGTLINSNKKPMGSIDSRENVTGITQRPLIKTLKLLIKLQQAISKRPRKVHN